MISQTGRLRLERVFFGSVIQGSIISQDRHGVFGVSTNNWNNALGKVRHGQTI